MIPYRHFVHRTHNNNQLGSPITAALATLASAVAVAATVTVAPATYQKLQTYTRLTGPKCKLSINNRETINEAGER